MRQSASSFAGSCSRWTCPPWSTPTGCDGLEPLERAAETVLTPHSGELGRLLGEESAWVDAHRLEALAPGGRAVRLRRPAEGSGHADRRARRGRAGRRRQRAGPGDRGDRRRAHRDRLRPSSPRAWTRARRPQRGRSRTAAPPLSRGNPSGCRLRRRRGAAGRARRLVQRIRTIWFSLTEPPGRHQPVRLLATRAAARRRRPRGRGSPPRLDGRGRPLRQPVRAAPVRQDEPAPQGAGRGRTGAAWSPCSSICTACSAWRTSRSASSARTPACKVRSGGRSRRSCRPTGLGLSLGTHGIGVTFQIEPRTSPLPAIHALLDLPVRVAERRETRVLVALDEFQDVLKVDDFDGLLRSHIQHHGEVASYVFSGSEPGMMRELFDTSTRPLYGQAEPLRLGPLADADVAAYVEERFRRDRPLDRRRARRADRLRPRASAAFDAARVPALGGDARRRDRGRRGVDPRARAHARADGCRVRGALEGARPERAAGAARDRALPACALRRGRRSPRSA